jgi:hypothetical protein
MRFDVAQEP